MGRGSVSVQRWAATDTGVYAGTRVALTVDVVDAGAGMCAVLAVHAAGNAGVVAGRDAELNADGTGNAGAAEMDDVGEMMVAGGS
jgi:hypothetical protein